METSRPAKLDVRSLTKANLDASGVADASPLSARSKLRRFASTSDLPPAIQPPRMKKRHSIAVSADDDFADYHSHNLRHVDALHGDLLFLPANATAAKVVYSHETLLMCILCIVAGVGAVAPAALIVDQEPAAMQLVMLGNYLYMIFYSLVVLATLLRSLGNEWTKRAFAEHGRLFNEVLFFQHFLGLPLVCSEPQLLLRTVKVWTTLAPRLWVYLFAHLAGNFVCSQACARVVASSSVLLNLVLTTMRFAAIVLSATLLARADAPRAGASLWGGAVLVSAGVIAFATSPPAIKERRKAHVSDPIPEEEA